MPWTPPKTDSEWKPPATDLNQSGLEGVVSDLPGGGWDQRKAEVATMNEMDPLGAAYGHPLGAVTGALGAGMLAAPAAGIASWAAAREAVQSALGALYKGATNPYVVGGVTAADKLRRGGSVPDAAVSGVVAGMGAKALPGMMGKVGQLLKFSQPAAAAAKAAPIATATGPMAAEVAAIKAGGAQANEALQRYVLHMRASSGGGLSGAQIVANLRTMGIPIKEGAQAVRMILRANGLTTGAM